MVSVYSMAGHIPSQSSLVFSTWKQGPVSVSVSFSFSLPKIICEMVINSGGGFPISRQG